MTTLNWWIISSNLEYCDVIRRNASGPNQQPERSAPLGAWSSSSPWWSSARSAPAFRSRSQGIGDDDDDDDDDDDGDDNDEEPLREVHLPPEADHKVLALSITTRCQFWHALLVFKLSEAFSSSHYMLTNLVISEAWYTIPAILSQQKSLKF